MKNIIRSLSVVVALLLVMTLSFSVLAEESSAVVSDTSVEASNDASDVSANESKDESAEASKDASKDVSTEASKAEDNHDHNHDHSNEQQNNTVVDETPWARIITLIVIVVLILVAFILTKTNTKLGQRIKKFCKEYWSEIKKVSWCSPKETAKATGVVLVFIIVAALVIGLLDLGFAKLINELAEIF
jgi:preprotein translocase SecE subunit